MTGERLDIGRRVHERLLTEEEAARKYGVSATGIYVYIKAYMRPIGIEPLPKGTKRIEPAKDYRPMTKDELHLRRCSAFGEVVMEIADYIDYYNNRRPQAGLGKMAPAEFRTYLLAKPIRLPVSHNPRFS